MNFETRPTTRQDIPIWCKHFGGDGDILLSKNHSGDQDERAWCGQFRGRRAPDGLYDHSGERVGVIPANWEVLVGMAGLIAEELLQGDTELADHIWERLEFRIWAGETSASDLEAMGISDNDDLELNLDDVEQTVQYLVEGWERVVSDAEFWMDYALTQASEIHSKPVDETTVPWSLGPRRYQSSSRPAPHGGERPLPLAFGHVCSDARKASRPAQALPEGRHKGRQAGGNG